MPDYQIEAPADAEAEILADWAEAISFIEGRIFVSRAYLRDRLRDALLLEDNDEFDAQMDLMLSEIGRRSEIAPLSYPFARDELRNGLIRRPEIDSNPYEFLLWLSISPAFRDQNRQAGTEESFNQIVRQALLAFLGPNGQVVETSTAVRAPGTTFRDLLRSIASMMRLRYGTWAEPRTQRKDGGVDLIGWRPFADFRPSFVVLLCQCTVQLQWPRKANDISVDLWRQWIDFARDPLTALAVPFAIPQSSELWGEVRANVDIIFDRLRLCELLEVERCERIDEMRTWCDGERLLLGI